MTEETIDKSQKHPEMHQKNLSFREKGFYQYIGKSLLTIVVVYFILILILFLVGKYLVDFNQLFINVLNRLSDGFVVMLFFASESFLGMIPVDLFVVWTQKFDSPLPWLALLGFLSYAGGVISYMIGRWISKRPRVRAYTEKKLSRYIGFIQKWGGAFIIIAALFPFTPFSLVVIAVTMLRFPFKPYLLFALPRLIRFVLQGLFFFDLLQVDKLFF